MSGNDLGDVAGKMCVVPTLKCFAALGLWIEENSDDIEKEDEAKETVSSTESEQEVVDAKHPTGGSFVDENSAFECSSLESITRPPVVLRKPVSSVTPSAFNTSEKRRKNEEVFAFFSVFSFPPIVCPNSN